MRARDLVADAITAGLAATGADDVDVRPGLRTVDGLTAPTVLVWSVSVVPSPLRMAWRDWTITAVCVVPQTDPTEIVEDALEDLLADVLTALDDATAVGILWTTAERVTLEGTWPAYRITTTATTATTEET